jgi:hypothetical protein
MGFLHRVTKAIVSAPAEILTGIEDGLSESYDKLIDGKRDKPKPTKEGRNESK